MRGKHSYWVVFACLLFSACGSGVSLELPPERPAGLVEGRLLDGNVRGGQLAIFSLAERKLLASGSLGEQGGFSLSVVNKTEPLLIEVSDFSYLEPGSGIEVSSTSGDTLRAIVFYESEQSVFTDITPFTHIIAGLTEYYFSRGDTAELALEKATTGFEQAFSFSAKHSLQKSAENSTAPAESDAARAMLLYTGLSLWTGDLSLAIEGSVHNSYHSLALLQFIYNDVRSDGQLDGKGVDISQQLVALQFSTQVLSPDLYHIGIPIRALAMLDEAQESDESLRVYLHGLANTRSTLFGTTASSFVENPPRVYVMTELNKNVAGQINIPIAIGSEAEPQSVVFTLDGKDILPGEGYSLSLDTKTLEDGEHILEVLLSDAESNQNNFSFIFYVDNTSPVTNKPVPLVVNNPNYVLTGNIIEQGAGIERVRVQGKAATITDDQWQVMLSLQAGKNDITIELVDKSGNRFETPAVIYLDIVNPVINTTMLHSDARFSLGKGDFVVDRLEDSNSDYPVLIESDHLDLNDVPVSRDDLNSNEFPFFAFTTMDPDSSGVHTDADKLYVRYQYEINEQVVAPWYRLDRMEDEYLVPLSGEYLGDRWQATTKNDRQAIRVRVEDEAGNRSETLFTFSAEIVSPELTVQLQAIINHELEQTSFSQRQTLLDRPVLADEYQLENTAGRSVLIRPRDSGVHSLQREWADVRRVHLARERRATQWRIGLVDSTFPAPGECPKASADWIYIGESNPKTELWNYTAAGWVTVQPPVVESEAMSFFTDTPVPPVDSEWVSVIDIDTDFASYDSSGKGYAEEISFHYDYLVEYSPYGETHPALLRNWKKTTVATQAIKTCGELRRFEQQFQYSYVSEPEYPKVLETSDQADELISGGRFLVIDKTGKPIEADQGWYRVSAGQSVTIKKFVQTSNIEVYSDEEANTPKSVTDYVVYRADRKYNWQIDDSLVVDYMHDNRNILLPESSVREIKLDGSSRGYLMVAE